MRCDPCKIRFLKVPWFLGHFVRCPKWKENSSEVVEYFSSLSKKKLVILRKPSKNAVDPAEELIRPPPPTCFTCFCGKNFMSQNLHSSHVQECLAKVMSNQPNLSIKPTTIGKHTVVQLDDEHYKVIIQETDQNMEISDGEPQGTLEHEKVEANNDPLEVESSEPEKSDRLEGKDGDEEEEAMIEDNIVIECPGEQDEDSLSICHEESLEVLQREVMVETDTLEEHELNETVLRLEYIEDGQEDTTQVAHEIEVGAYEEVKPAYVNTEYKSEEDPSLKLGTDKTLDIETTVCECGEKVRCSDLSNHLQACSHFIKTTDSRKSSKVLVLITCVCRGKFTKVDIKQHLLYCKVWKSVKQKKNLEGSQSNTEVDSRIHHIEEVYIDTATIENEPVHSDETLEIEETCDEERLKTLNDPKVEGNESEIQITQIMSACGNTSDIQHSSYSSIEEGEEGSSTGDNNQVTSYTIEVPKVIYPCECGARFRHLNVFKVHQSSCSQYLKSQGKSEVVVSSMEQKVHRKEDIVMKYSTPMQGEVLVNRKCQCGFVIETICAYRQHKETCPIVSAAEEKKCLSKIHVSVVPKRPPLISSKKRRVTSKMDDARNALSDEKSETSKRAMVPGQTPSVSKKSKVELQDELKDFVKLPSGGKPPSERPKKKK